MKRCPVCEFIYEDDQSLCDMDQMDLVALPPEQSASLESNAPAKKRERRRFALLALIGILCLVLFFQYYKGELAFELSGKNQAAAASSYDAQAEPVRSDVAPQPLSSPQPRESPSPVSHSPTKPAAKVTPAETAPAESTPVKIATPASKEVKPGPTHTSSLPQPAAEKARPKPLAKDQSNGSKVSSFLKKTGRVLKKPFQF